MTKSTPDFVKHSPDPTDENANDRFMMAILYNHKGQEIFSIQSDLGVSIPREDVPEDVIDKLAPHIMTMLKAVGNIQQILDPELYGQMFEQAKKMHEKLFNEKYEDVKNAIYESKANIKH